MVRPANFGYNSETALSNHYQNVGQHTHEGLQQQALVEFDQFVALLNRFDILVEIIEDDNRSIRPDAIFPNNWFSTHPGKRLVVYPMQAVNRRAERREDVLLLLREKYGYQTLFDFSPYERDGLYLEGTGSVLFDHDHNIAWASFSSRTHADVLLDVCEKLGLLPIVFCASDTLGRSIYHTNVLMALHPQLAIVCLEAITDATDRHTVERMLRKTGRDLLVISQHQVSAFAGNALFVKNRLGNAHVIMSSTGWHSLNAQQQQQLSAIAVPITPDIKTIEQIGGGSARCMLAELF